MKLKEILIENQGTLVPYSNQEHQSQVKQIDLDVFGEPLSVDEYKECSGLVYQIGNEVVGYILWDISSTIPHIRSLAVKNKYSSAGYGSNLITAALHKLGPTVTVSIDNNDERLKQFYGKFGFQWTGQVNPVGNEVWQRLEQ